MTDREATQLIFLPGFSTAEQVTNVSGRGVGMDVVKTNIEKIGGSVDLQSRLGHGTTLRIKIPLTLAIIPALIVTSGGDRYAIPQVNLLELVRLDGEQARRGIETIQGAPVYRLRGNLLPLVYLHEELGVDARAPTDDDAINIVVLQADDRQFGLVVDGVNDTEEIVVKPLGQQLKGISAFAGATIMGDGRVALILDVLGIAQQAGWSPRSATGRWSTPVDAAEESRPTARSCSWPRSATARRLAIPLRAVDRLEELSTGADRARRRHPGGAVPRPDPAAGVDRPARSASPGRRLWTATRSGCSRSWSTASATGASGWWWSGSSTSSRRSCGSSGQARRRAWSGRPSSSPG